MIIFVSMFFILAGVLLMGLSAKREVSFSWFGLVCVLFGLASLFLN